MEIIKYVYHDLLLEPAGGGKTTVVWSIVGPGGVAGGGVWGGVTGGALVVGGAVGGGMNTAAAQEVSPG